MDNYCGANCGSCPNKQNCRGCKNTCGSPFGGKCIAAEYIKANGADAYNQFKQQLLGEINTLLTKQGAPKAQRLYELTGKAVNLEYSLPDGKKVKLLEDKNIYLGTQITSPESGICYGALADTSFILLCTYGVNGSNPKLLLHKKRK